MTDDEKDRAIEILFKEYGALKSEILENQRGRFQLIGFAGVAGAVIVGMSQSGVTISNLSILLSAIPIAIAIFLLWATGRMMTLCGERMIEIEEKVNEIAGEELLTWEKYWARKSWPLGWPVNPKKQKKGG